MTTKIPPFRVSELSPDLREFATDFELDANADGLLDAADVDAIRSADVRSARARSAKEELLKVATGGIDAFSAPRTSATSERIRSVVLRRDRVAPREDSPVPPSEISTHAIKELLEDVSPLSLRVGEREQLLSAILDDAWVAPVDLWDFGLLAENQEELVTRIIEGTPENQKAELAARLVAGVDEGLYGLIRARVNGADSSRRIAEALGPALLAASLAADVGDAGGDVAPTTRAVGTERARTDDAVDRVSRYLGREYFPFGGAFQGLSYRAQSGRGDTLGPVTLQLHDREGGTIPLGTIDPGHYETSDLMFKAVLDRFNEYYFGVSGRLRAPAPWATLAADLVPPAAAPSHRPGASLVPLLRWTELPDERGRGGVRVFQLPRSGYAKLLGLPSQASMEEVKTGLEARLRRLGVAEPEVRETPKRKGYLRLPAAQAELLLKARAFAQQPSAAGLAPKGWDFLRLLDNEPRFVLPLSESLKLDSVVLPDGATPNAENLTSAVNDRLERFGLGRSASHSTLDGVEVLTMAPEHARLLLKASHFDFKPHAAGLDSNNLYWSARFSDLVYADFTKDRAQIEAQLKAWGFDRFELISQRGSEVLVASNGRMVMVACRGTQGTGDIVTDLKTLSRTKARAADADVPEGALEQRTFAGRRVRLHRGFSGQVAATQSEVARAITALNGDGALPVWLTGHSKGGAEASILALTLETGGIHVAGGYGIEAARAGDAEFVRLAQETGLASRWFQFQMAKDPVPHVPLRAMGFQAYGTIISPDRVSAQPNWGQTAAERVRAVRAAMGAGEAVGAHQMPQVFATIERGYFDSQWTPPVDEPNFEQ